MPSVQRVPTAVVVAARRMLARRPWIHWIIVAALALALGATVRDRLAEVDAARDAWGATTPVLVAVRDAAPGEPITAERRDVPTAVVPERPASVEVDAPVARQWVSAGAIVSAADVAPTDEPLALAPSGWLVVPVAERSPSGAAPGERVMVASDGVVLADDAMVVGTHGDAVLVATPERAAPAVAAAGQTAAVTILRRP